MNIWIDWTEFENKMRCHWSEVKWPSVSVLKDISFRTLKKLRNKISFPHNFEVIIYQSITNQSLSTQKEDFSAVPSKVVRYIWWCKITKYLMSTYVFVFLSEISRFGATENRFSAFVNIFAPPSTPKRNVVLLLWPVRLLRNTSRT